MWMKLYSNYEGLLDCVEAGTVQWKTVVRNFYPDLKHDVDEAEKELEKVDIQDEVTDVICDNCGRNMVIKYGPHGRFLACPGFPDCRNTKPYYEKIGVACPKCGGEIVMKKTKKAENITDVRIIRNVILCPGRNRQIRNVRSAEVIWLRKEINLSAVRKPVAM
mgnify:CR=1 FL=1